MTRGDINDGVWRATRRFVQAIVAQAGRRGPSTAALVAVGALLEGASIVLLVPILTIVLAPGQGDRVGRALADAGVSGRSTQLGVLLAGFVALMGLRAIVLYRRDVALADLQTGFVEDIRNRVIATLAAASWQRVVGLQHARVTNLLGADIARIAGSTQLLIQASVAAAMLAIQMGIAIALSPVIGGAVSLMLLAGGGLVLRRSRWAHDRGAALTAAHLALMQTTTGFLGGLKAAMAENAQGRFAAEFAAMQVDMRGHQVGFVRRQARGRMIFALASAIAGAGVVGAGVALGVAGGVLITLIVVFARMNGPVATIHGALQTVVFGLPGFQAVCALEDELRDDRPPADGRAPPDGAIELAGAGFVHPGDRGISDVTLTIAPGAIVGLSGPSGAGKTSLVDLLAGLVAPQSGSLSVGGVVLDDAGRAGWRGCVGYVAQDGFLFHDSVRRNLTRDDAIGADAVAAALAVTGADAVVARLPDGMDTVVGERGARLSGGERQRLAIARALLRRPRLLVLDEATSAIDPAGEAALLDRLVALDPRPAIVIVAHRADSLARCDHVLRVEAGRIVG